MNEGFVYCWTDHLTHRLYVGSHVGTTDDGYVGSGKHFRAEYDKRPHDFTREIVAFGTEADCTSLESAILKSENVANNPMYYNMMASSPNQHGKTHADKISKALKGKASAWMKGRKPDPKTVEKIAAANRGQKRSAETRANISASKKGKKQSPEVVEMIKNKIASMPLETCPRCGYEGKKQVTRRYHFDRCKA